MASPLAHTPSPSEVLHRNVDYSQSRMLDAPDGPKAGRRRRRAGGERARPGALRRQPVERAHQGRVHLGVCFWALAPAMAFSAGAMRRARGDGRRNRDQGRPGHAPDYAGASRACAAVLGAEREVVEGLVRSLVAALEAAAPLVQAGATPQQRLHMHGRPVWVRRRPVFTPVRSCAWPGSCRRCWQKHTPACRISWVGSGRVGSGRVRHAISVPGHTQRRPRRRRSKCPTQGRRNSPWHPGSP